MIVKVNARGRSFKGLTAYLMNGRDNQSQERVAWHRTGNLHTDDPEAAARFMAWTEKSAESLKAEAGVSTAGRKVEVGGVYHYSLSWAPGETPEEAHQRQQAETTLERLGLQRHQYVLVAHNDTAHAHVHVMVNLTDPETGKRASLSFDQTALQEWALEYERAHGLHCENREQNARRRERGEPTKYQDERQAYAEKVRQAYEQADSGRAFAAALEAQGLTLAQGRRGGAFVIVDEHGDIQKLSRQIEGVKAKDIKARLADIDVASLPVADELARSRQEQVSVQREGEGEGSGAQGAAAPPAENNNTKEESPHEHRSTAEIAQDYVQLSQYPLSDLRRWLDETNAEGQQDRGLPSGSPAGTPGDCGLRSLRAGATEDHAVAASDNTPAPLDAQMPAELPSDAKRSVEAAAAWRAARAAEIANLYKVKELEEKHRQAADHAQKKTTFWGWITGQKRAAEEASEAARKSLENARWREQEALRALDRHPEALGQQTSPQNEIEQARQRLRAALDQSTSREAEIQRAAEQAEREALRMQFNQEVQPRQDRERDQGPSLDRD